MPKYQFNKVLILVPIIIVGGIIAVIAWSALADDGGCSATEQFTIDYKLLDSEEYKNTNLYLKDGLSMQNFGVTRGNCSNPNTIAWNNLTDHDIVFHANFTGQDNDILIKPNNSYLYTFNNKGTYSYMIGEIDDTITIN